MLLSLRKRFTNEFKNSIKYNLNDMQRSSEIQVFKSISAQVSKRIDQRDIN